MTTATLDRAPAAAVTPRLPGVLIVLRLQLLLLWRTRRLVVPFVLLFGALALIEFVEWRARMPDMTATSIAAGLLPLLIALALLWALLVWRDEEPAKRSYHWSMPVDVTVHDCARVVAGGILLTALLSAFYAAVYALAAMHGNLDYLHQLGTRHALSYVLAPLLFYVLVNVLAVGSGRPGHWLLGLYFAMVVIVLTAEASGFAIDRFVRPVLGSEPWGLMFAFTGGRPGAPGGIWIWLSTWLLWMTIAASGVVAISIAQRGRR